MARIPASERTHEQLQALMEGRSQATDGRSELVHLAARFILAIACIVVLSERVVAAECYTDRELMAAVVLRNLTAETVQIEQCALRSGNTTLTAKWEAFLSRHRSRVQEQEALVTQAYQRIFGTAWQSRLGLDMQLVRAQGLGTDFGGRTPAECSNSYEAFFEGQSYLDDADSWGGIFNAYRAQFDVERRQVPRC